MNERHLTQDERDYLKQEVDRRRRIQIEREKMEARHSRKNPEAIEAGIDRLLAMLDGPARPDSLISGKSGSRGHGR